MFYCSAGSALLRSARAVVVGWALAKRAVSERASAVVCTASGACQVADTRHKEGWRDVEGWAYSLASWVRRITSSCSGRSNPKRGAPQARHFIVRSRRAATGSAPPLNCGVIGQQPDRLRRRCGVYTLRRCGSSGTRRSASRTLRTTVSISSTRTKSSPAPRSRSRTTASTTRSGGLLLLGYSTGYRYR